MNATEAKVGTRVIYDPGHGRAERGVVTGVPMPGFAVPNGTVRVRYAGDTYSKTTRIADLAIDPASRKG